MRNGRSLSWVDLVHTWPHAGYRRRGYADGTRVIDTVPLKLEQHRELWHYDTDGNRVIASVRRFIPVMDGICRDGLKLRRNGFGLLWERRGSPVKGRHRCHTAIAHELFRRKALTAHLPEVLEEATSDMSSGSVSPDLDDTWHHGLPMSPQWEERIGTRLGQ